MSLVVFFAAQGYDRHRQRLLQLHLRITPEPTSGMVFSAVDESAPVRVPDCPYPLHAPAGELQLRGIGAELEATVTSWIRAAGHDSPNETHALLQNFVRRLTLHASRHWPAQHRGIAVALEAASQVQHMRQMNYTPSVTAPYAKNAAVPPVPAPGSMPPMSSGGGAGSDMLSGRMYEGASELRAHYLGEIDGMRAFHSFDLSGSAISAVSFDRVIVYELMRELNRLTKRRVEMMTAELEATSGGAFDLEADSDDESWGGRSDSGGESGDSDVDDGGEDASTAADGGASDGKQSDDDDATGDGGDGGDGGKGSGAKSSGSAAERRRSRSISSSKKQRKRKSSSKKRARGSSTSLKSPARWLSSVPRRSTTALAKARSKMSKYTTRMRRAVRTLRERRGGQRRSTMPMVSDVASVGTKAATDKWMQMLRRLRGRLRHRGDLENAIQVNMFRAAAFLVWSHNHKREHHPSATAGVRELVRYLAWVPALVFTPNTLHSAVFAWNWVLSAVPTYRLMLLSEIGASFCWTVQQRYGLFAGDAVSVSVSRGNSRPFDAPHAPSALRRAGMEGVAAAASSGEDGPTMMAAGVAGLAAGLEGSAGPGVGVAVGGAGGGGGGQHVGTGGCALGSSRRTTSSRVLPDSLVNVQAHHLWLNFFMERYRVVSTRSTEEVAVICHVVNASLADVTRLSTQPSAFGTRILLLTLAQRVMRAARESTTRRTMEAAEEASVDSSSRGGGGGGGIASSTRSSSGSESLSLSPAFQSEVVRDSSCAYYVPLGGVGATLGPHWGRDSGLALFGLRAAASMGALLLHSDSAASGRGRGSSSKSGLTPVHFAEGMAPVHPGLHAGISLMSAQSLRGSTRDGLSASTRSMFASSPTVAASGGAGAGAGAGAGGGGLSAADLGVPLGAELDDPASAGVSGFRWWAMAVGSVALLRERILRAVLGWFEAAPSWYEVATSRESVRSEFGAIVLLCRHLKADLAHAACSDVFEGVSGGGGAAMLIAAIEAEATAVPKQGNRHSAPALLGADGRSFSTAAAIMQQRAGRAGSAGLRGARGMDLPRIDLDRVRGGRGPGLGLTAGGSTNGSGSPAANVSDIPRPVTPQQSARLVSASARGQGYRHGLHLGGSTTSSSLRAVRHQGMSTNFTSLRVRPPLHSFASHELALRGGVHASFRQRVATIREASRRVVPTAEVLLGTAGSNGGATAGATDRSAARYDSRHWNRRGTMGGDLGARSSIGSVTSLVSVNAASLATSSAPPRPSSRSRGASGAPMPTPSPVPGASPRKPGPGQPQARTSIRLQRLTDLALIMMSHEVDRIVAWHNPNDVDALRLPGEREFSLDASGTLTAARWERLVKDAWHLSPSLAVAMRDRFLWRGDIIRPLEQLVHSDPTAVMTNPDALPLLATRAAVEADDAALRHLLYWVPTAMPNVLRLVSRNGPERVRPREPLFVHPRVADYVGRCLRASEPHNVVFYLPQLVQALRFDRHGHMDSFMMETALTSVEVAHQLMWVLLTEAKREEPEHGELDRTRHGFQGELPGDDPLPILVTDLASRVESSFPPAAKALYLRQFAFFEQVHDAAPL